MALLRVIQEYITLDANNITLVFDSGNIVNISGNINLYPPQGHPILYNSFCVVVFFMRFPCRKCRYVNVTFKFRFHPLYRFK